MKQQRLLQQRIEVAASREKILKQLPRPIVAASAAYPAEQAQQLLQAQQLVLDAMRRASATAWRC